MIQETVHLVFSSTSAWEKYDKAMKNNLEQWLDNQYPENCSSRVASQALEKIIREDKNKKNIAGNKKPSDYSSDSPPILMVQYRGSHSQTLAKKSAAYHKCADNIRDEEEENLYTLFQILVFQ